MHVAAHTSALAHYGMGFLQCKTSQTTTKATGSNATPTGYQCRVGSHYISQENQVEHSPPLLRRGLDFGTQQNPGELKFFKIKG